MKSNMDIKHQIYDQIWNPIITQIKIQVVTLINEQMNEK